METNKNIIKVLIVDDSAVVRTVLKQMLSRDPGIEVVGTANDPYEAREKILKLKPDVLTLDIEMPKMDGLTFLKILMEHRPIPIIIISSLTLKGSDIALEAIEAGAVDVINKPEQNASLGEIIPQVVEKVKAAACARLSSPSSKLIQKRSSKVTAAPFEAKIDKAKIMLIGASTGGTEAIKEVLTALPERIPPICIVQHIPPVFSNSFARRMNELCPFEVKEAESGDIVKAGRVLIAPGGYHMILKQKNNEYYVELNQEAQVWHQRPAVDILFKTASRVVGNNAVAAILTGMGKDGAEGLLDLRKQGCRTFSQSEKTCVVYGMPKVAHEIGASEAVIDLPEMAKTLMRAIKNESITIS